MALSDGSVDTIGALAASPFGAHLADSGSLHIVLALAVFPLMAAVVWTSPRATILGLILSLAALGMVRRLVGSGSSTGLGDPLVRACLAVFVADRDDTSTVTLAVHRFDNATSEGTEDDFGNAGRALRHLLYDVVVFRGFGSTNRLATPRRDDLALAILGLIALSFVGLIAVGFSG
jgi:hypothetical protein